MLSDRLGMRYDRLMLIKISGAMTCVGLGVAILAPSIGNNFVIHIVIAVIGLAIAGAGLSICMPIVASSAGDVPNMAPADAISTVVSMSYLGFLLGPPFFGAMGDLLGAVRWSLLLCTGVIAVIVLCPGAPPPNTRQQKARAAHLQMSKQTHQSAVASSEELLVTVQVRTSIATPSLKSANGRFSRGGDDGQEQGQCEVAMVGLRIEV